MSHGQKSLKATALDKFSYAPEDIQKKASCVVPQGWTTPSCPSDGENINYVPVIKWNMVQERMRWCCVSIQTPLSVEEKNQIKTSYSILHDFIYVKFRNWQTKLLCRKAQRLKTIKGKI